ncbi:MAG: Glu-tRNA(Gln) amidotransferase subunit GatD [Candidatus Hodarchaeales archaeon]|jgi:glutamyl-tRNA(Gln) amidotransferase subunit D
MNNSEEDLLPGYTGKTRDLLEKNNLEVWSRIKITKTNGASFSGILLPRAAFTASDYVTLRVLDTGYNIGVEISDDIKFESQGFSQGNYRLPSIEIHKKTSLPDVVLLGTGGTVASRLDYRTGAVLPAFTPEELFAAVPEIQTRVNLTPRTLFEILSENFKPEYWVKTAEEIAKEIDRGVDGIIIGHGTDTMAYTGSALSYFLQNLPIPVIILGSQRSSDRPSSDAAINLLNAATVAGYADIGEVLISMMGSTSHLYDYLHRPTRVRKMHSSRRDTFRSLSASPVGKINWKTQKISYFSPVKPRSPQEGFVLDTKIDKRVAILYFYPGMDPDILNSVIDKGYHGIVIIGTGLGHVSTDLYKALDRAQEEKIPIVMVVQPLFGFCHLRVYETGREMLARGVIEGVNMLPEAAYPKLAWVLGHTGFPPDLNEVKKLMQTNIAGEITQRETRFGFSVLQGIEPGIEDLFESI